MADSLHEQHDQQKTEDESAADHDHVTQTQDPEILSLSETNVSVPKPLISESPMPLPIPPPPPPPPAPAAPPTAKSSSASASASPSPSAAAAAAASPSPSAAAAAAAAYAYASAYASAVPMPLRIPPTPPPRPPPPRAAPSPSMAASLFSGYQASTNMGILPATVFGRNIIIVTPENLQSNSTKDEEERFLEEAAVCKICFKKFEAQNMFMTNCNCPKRLVHEGCINGNARCDHCEQEVRSFPVKWRLESIKSDINKQLTPKQGK